MVNINEVYYPSDFLVPQKSFVSLGSSQETICDSTDVAALLSFDSYKMAFDFWNALYVPGHDD